MKIEDVTAENFGSIMMCDSTRSHLLSAMRAQTDSSLSLMNHVSEIAEQFETNRQQLTQIVTAELQANRDDFLQYIVFRSDIEESILFQIYDSGLCLIQLAHRSGPASLLERIAKDERIEEAVLTLLLSYYATDEYSDSQFVRFVRDYADVHGLRYELENKRNIPEHKRRLGLEVLAEKPR